MLQADKQVLLAGVKRNALELRQRELEFHVERYTNLATQASVVAGFSFESLVELEVPEGTNPVLASFYFVFGATAMALALYVLCVASFACVFGHRLALQGPHGSLEKAVHILIDHRLHIFAIGGLSLASLVCAAVLMAWIKMGLAAGAVSLIFVTFGWGVYSRMYLMLELFQIPEDELVTGATRVANPKVSGAFVDLSKINPASRGNNTESPNPRAGAYSRLSDDANAGEPAAVDTALKYEGYLWKKGEPSMLPAPFGSGTTTRRRYFVLMGYQLFYFRTWEDYGAGGLRASVNATEPIDLREHEPVVVREDDGSVRNRFDLVKTTDPLARTWRLEAGDPFQASEWLTAFNAARQLERGPSTHVGQASVITVAQG